MSFTFSFSGDDIEEAAHDLRAPTDEPKPQATASAFPVEGKPQIPARRHDLSHMLSQLPSKIAYGLLDVTLDDGTTISIPRRELWDVRLQLMAEDDGSGSATEGLGSSDVKTGVYEGGFKSWESSLDLVKVLASGTYLSDACANQVIELGCGTALPSLAIFQQALSARLSSSPSSSYSPLLITLADYNPTVLQLVTLPNFILAWALSRANDDPALRDAFTLEGELELLDEVKTAFQAALASTNISTCWLSGGWSAEFVDLLYSSNRQPASLDTLILGAETIYSPFALNCFYETLLTILQREKTERANCHARALVGAKRLYFGVGGSLDDFIVKATDGGVVVEQLREETEGVRRGVVLCRLPLA